MARQSKPWFWKARKSWFVTIAGERHNLGPNKKQALDRFHQLMGQPQKRRVAPQSLAGLIDSFLEWVQRNRSPDTYEWYRYRLQRFVETYPDLRIGDLRPYHVQQWVDGYPSLSVTSRRNYLRSVKRCLKWAQQQGYVDENPIAYLEVPVAERKEVLITPQEYERLVANAGHPTFRDLIVVTWETGCRPQELLRVEARHIDLKNSRWVFPTNEAKGKRAPRVVYLSQNAIEITKRLSIAHPSGKLFRNADGSPWTTDAVNSAFDRARTRMGRAEIERTGVEISDEEIQEFTPTLSTKKRCNGVEQEKTAAELRAEAKRKLKAQVIAKLVPRYSLYALRHSWATRALQSGLDGLTVAVLMGHSDPSTLARVYQHLSHNPDHLLKQARKAAG